MCWSPEPQGMSEYICALTCSVIDGLISQFFINFCQGTAVFTAFVFASLVAFVIRINAINGVGDLDPQKIVIIVLYVSSQFIPPHMSSLTNVCAHIY